MSLQPLSRRHEVQLWNALRSSVPGSIKVGLRSMHNGWSVMVVVHYQQVIWSRPEAPPVRRWFKLSSAFTGYKDDAQRATRSAAILAEAEAIVETARAQMANRRTTK